MNEQTPRKDWPLAVQLRVLKELLEETPNTLLAKYVGVQLHTCTCSSVSYPDGLTH